MKLEITRMLTINTCHVSKETTDLIRDNCESYTDLDLPAFYTKGDYGYLVNVPFDYLVDGPKGVIEMYPDVPDDLHDCILLAMENHCDWLCLDRDGMVVEGLPVFDW